MRESMMSKKILFKYVLIGKKADLIRAQKTWHIDHQNIGFHVQYGLFPEKSTEVDTKYSAKIFWKVLKTRIVEFMYVLKSRFSFDLWCENDTTCWLEFLSSCLYSFSQALWPENHIQDAESYSDSLKDMQWVIT